MKKSETTLAEKKSQVNPTTKRAHNFIDRTGQRFGRLVAIKFLGVNKHKKTMWLCRCDCGNECSTSGCLLITGHTKSCGCLKRDMCRIVGQKLNLTHGWAASGKRPEYKAWTAIKTRCLNKKSHSFLNYGGRGIKICKRWLRSFEAFLKDMGERPSKDHSIERINNNGDYKHDNCKWATRKEQGQNKRNNRILEFDGRIQSASRWADEIGMGRQTLLQRLKHGWSVRMALTLPINKSKSHSNRAS